MRITIGTCRSRRVRVASAFAIAVMFAVAAPGAAAVSYVYTSSIKVLHPYASPEEPGQAIFKTDVSFESIQSVCVHVWFSESDPLDPGDSLRFTPNNWLDASPSARGPGYTNVSGLAQTFRTLCSVNYLGYPLDRFIAEFMDGRQVFKLHADTGSVLFEQIDVEIVGV